MSLLNYGLRFTAVREERPIVLFRKVVMALSWDFAAYPKDVVPQRIFT